jgi:hypothetical protein
MFLLCSQLYGTVAPGLERGTALIVWIRAHGLTTKSNDRFARALREAHPARSIAYR